MGKIPGGVESNSLYIIVKKKKKRIKRGIDLVKRDTTGKVQVGELVLLFIKELLIFIQK